MCIKKLLIQYILGVGAFSKIISYLIIVILWTSERDYRLRLTCQRTCNQKLARETYFMVFAIGYFVFMYLLDPSCSLPCFSFPNSSRKKTSLVTGVPIRKACTILTDDSSSSIRTGSFKSFYSTNANSNPFDSNIFASFGSRCTLNMYTSHQNFMGIVPQPCLTVHGIMLQFHVCIESTYFIYFSTFPQQIYLWQFITSKSMIIHFYSENYIYIPLSLFIYLFETMLFPILFGLSPKYLNGNCRTLEQIGAVLLEILASFISNEPYGPVL